jgi:ATP-dependent DNA ligase
MASLETGFSGDLGNDFITLIENSGALPDGVAQTYTFMDLEIAMSRCPWVKPVLVVQVKFTEWTHDGQLRQPVFLGVRTDIEAKDVVS